MAVTDLTGTTWILNNNFSATAGYGLFSIDCIVDSYSSTGQLGIGYDMVFDPMMGPTFGPQVDSIMTNPDYHRWLSGDALEITGGSDVTNQSLITWLQANAVQQGGSGYTGTITSSGYNSTVQYLRYPSDSSGTVYYTAGDTISVTSGDSVYFYCNAGPTNNIYLDGTSVGTTSYTWTPDADFEVAFTASIASWGRVDITRNVPSTPGVTITYGGETVTTIDEDGTTTLPTNGKYMSTDVIVSGTDVYSTEITYNGNTIATGTGTFTKTLQCADKVMNSNVGIVVQMEEPVVPDNNCITFTTSATTATLATANSLKNWNGTLQYSYDKAHWNDWDGTTTISFSSGVLHLRGKNNTYLTGSSSSAPRYRFVITTNPSIVGNVSCTGNIETLLDWETVKNGGHPTMGSYCFGYLFYQCTALSSAPSLLGTSIPSYAYTAMFYGCTGLTTPPALDATLTTSSTYCYYLMFYGCTGLTSTPTLASSVLAQYCYASMFYECTNITSAPALNATALQNSCYQSMFYGCTKLTSTPALPATTLKSYCYQSMFRGCTALTTITRPSGKTSDLPATTMQASCYQNMFNNCTNLVNGPVFTVSTTASSCCNNMFYGCTKLTNPSITLSATTVTSSCYSSMFCNCKAITATLALPATTLNTNCYEYMYQGCTALTTITIPSGKTVPLPATTLKNYCYRGMFYGCTALTTMFKLPATTLGTYCYSRMFRGCTKLEQLPALPVTTVSNQAYYQMFYGCSKIMLSTTQTGNYQTAYRIPTSGTGTFGTNSGYQMFTSTGGTFKNTAAVNTTYYTSNTVIS